MNQLLKSTGLIFWCCSLVNMAYGQWSDFQFQRSLSGISDTWHQIEFPNDLFGHAQPDLSDLRIFGIKANGDTLEAPYVLDWPASERLLPSEEFTIINQSRRQQTFYATLSTSSSEPLNQIRLDFGNANFDWRVRLEGSQDQQEWFQILEDYRLLAFQDQGQRYRFATLNFPMSNYRYYRLSIPATEEVRLQKAYYIQGKTVQPDYRSYPIAGQRIEENKDRQRTEIQIDLPWPVPVSSLELPVLDSLDFYRPLRIELLTDSTKTEKGWTFHYSEVHRGILSSLEPPVFRFSTTRSRSIRVYINHADNAPLRLGTVLPKGLPPTLSVRFAEPADYFLLYGKSDALPPHYDLARFVSQIPEDLSLLNLGPEVRLQPNTQEKGPLFAHPAWLWAVMILVIGLLGWFSLKMLKQAEQ